MLSPKFLSPKFDGKLLVEVVHACTDRIANKLGGRAHRASV